jgi:hypothetical protein
VHPCSRRTYYYDLRFERTCRQGPQIDNYQVCHGHWRKSQQEILKMTKGGVGVGYTLLFLFHVRCFFVFSVVCLFRRKLISVVVHN